MNDLIQSGPIISIKSNVWYNSIYSFTPESQHTVDLIDESMDFSSSYTRAKVRDFYNKGMMVVRKQSHKTCIKYNKQYINTMRRKFLG